LSREKLNDVTDEVVVCTKCRLWKSRKNAVPGEGNSEARIMLIGEAPGASEDIQGKPFVGMAGKFLETLLAELGLSRKDIFICNVVKCRPPRNRVPRVDEVQTCTPYLDRQMKIVRPEFVVTLGNCSTAYIFSRTNLPFSSITRTRGRVRKVIFCGIHLKVFPTFHPAAALYSAEYKAHITADFRLLKEKLKKE
jgi:uracil-DNA glycosylase family 4